MNEIHLGCLEGELSESEHNALGERFDATSGILTTSSTP